MYSRINNDESSVGGLILAAGLSTRMGQSKPLTKFLDKKLIDQTIKTMQEAGIDNIQIVTGFENERVEAYLQDNYSSDHIHTIWNSNYGNGSILTSIKTGLAELTDYELVFIQLVDLPCIMSETYQKLLEAMLVNGKKAVLPTVNGRRGHPALIRMDLLADILIIGRFAHAGIYHTGRKTVYKTVIFISLCQISEVSGKDIGVDRCLCDKRNTCYAQYQ